MMPWFAWLYLALMVAICGFVLFCAWDINRIARRIGRRR